MVTVNGEIREASGLNLLEFLENEGYEIKRIVVEVNLEIIPIEKLGSVVIKDEDTIEVLNFVGGG